MIAIRASIRIAARISMAGWEENIFIDSWVFFWGGAGTDRRRGRR